MPSTFQLRCKEGWNASVNILRCNTIIHLLVICNFGVCQIFCNICHRCICTGNIILIKEQNLNGRRRQASFFHRIRQFHPRCGPFCMCLPPQCHIICPVCTGVCIIIIEICLCHCIVSDGFSQITGIIIICLQPVSNNGIILILISIGAPVSNTEVI